MKNQVKTETKFYKFNTIVVFSVFIAYMIFAMIVIGVEAKESFFPYCGIAAIPAVILCLPFGFFNLVKFLLAKNAKLICKQEAVLDGRHTELWKAGMISFSANMIITNGVPRRVYTEYVFHKSSWKIRPNRKIDYDGKKVEIAYNPRTKKAVVIGLVSEKKKEKLWAELG